MNYRLKILLSLGVYIIFFFVIFYPFVVPWLNKNNIHPLLATIIFETLLFTMLYLLSSFLIGEGKQKQKLKTSVAFFIIYHIIDAVEPPFIISPTGIPEILPPTAIISWDYGIGYTLHQIGVPWTTTYWLINIIGLLILLIIIVLLIQPQLLGKLVRKVLK